MYRIFLAALFLLGSSLLATGQTPGVDPRGVMMNSSPVIIGEPEESLRRVIRPDKMSKEKCEGRSSK
jgi:hypothetical protein